MRFQMFDSVKLTEEIPLTDGGTAAIGTVGAIVEVFKNGEAYMVELFGEWVKYDAQENFVPATPEEPQSFVETIGVETIYPHQLQLYKPASETVGLQTHLQSILDELPEVKLAEVRDFAEFLRDKEQQINTRKIEQNY